MSHLRLVIAIAAALLAAAPFVLPPYPLGLLLEALLFGLFAMSLDLLVGWAGLVSLGHAAAFGLGGYTLALVTLQGGASLLPALAAALLLAAGWAALTGALCVRGRGVGFLMLTLAFAQLLHTVAYKWTSLTGGTNGLAGIPRPPLTFGPLGSLPVEGETAFYFVVLAAAALGALLLHRVGRSPLGHILRGIRANEARMRALGFPVVRYKVAALTLAGALAAVAGALHAAYTGYVSPDSLDWITSGEVLIMVLLGGAGTLVGPVVGAAIFLFLREVVSTLTQHWMLYLGALFMACVLLFPQGLVGVLRGRRA
ncbi:MAG: branched-chain amino acid ABC transporter permease [candidate division NC10 bacterium]|nr:branched-chain amino acid ABC transporter permease [candidate division NC10 bacterium]